MKITSISDLHIPYHDPIVVRHQLDHIKAFKPDIIVLNGDIGDMYSVSSFDKNPANRNLKVELDQVNNYLDELRGVAGDALIVYMYGNHEFRLEKYISRKASELDGLISLHEILKLDERNMPWFKYGEKYRVDGIVFMHGKKLGARAGYGVQRQFDNVISNLCIGHTHKAAQTYRTIVGKVYTLVEQGCSCLMAQDYLEDEPDWQHAFVDFTDGVPNLHVL